MTLGTDEKNAQNFWSGKSEKDEEKLKLIKHATKIFKEIEKFSIRCDMDGWLDNYIRIKKKYGAKK